MVDAVHDRAHDGLLRVGLRVDNVRDGELDGVLVDDVRAVGRLAPLVGGEPGGEAQRLGPLRQAAHHLGDVRFNSPNDKGTTTFFLDNFTFYVSDKRSTISN